MSARDISLAKAAELCLDRNLSLPTGQVAVDVKNGWVTLSGCLEWRFQRAAAEHGLADLAGFVGLTNHITIEFADEDEPQIDPEFVGKTYSRIRCEPTLAVP